MKRLSISEIANIFGSKLKNNHLIESVVFQPLISGFSIDCRDVVAGDIIFILSEPGFDHLQYLMLAQQNGAVVAVVEQVYPEVSLPQIVVENTFEALIATVRWWSNNLDTDTGSVINSLRKHSPSSLAS